MSYRLSVMLIVLATMLATALAAPTKAPLLNAYRFRDWQQVKSTNTDNFVFQAWQQPLADLPRDVTGYTLIAYQAERVSTSSLAAHRIKTFTEKQRFSDYAGRGYVVTLENWFLDGEQGAYFTVRGMDHKSDHIAANRAEVYTYAIAIDDWVILAELRQSFTAEDLAPVDKAAKNAKARTMAEDFTRYVRSVWNPTLGQPVTEPIVPQQPTTAEPVKEPVKEPETTKQPETTKPAEPELVIDPVPVKTEPVKEPEPVKQPDVQQQEPVKEPEVKQPETAKEPEAVKQPEVEPIKQPEPVKEPEVKQPEAVKEPEAVKQPETVKEPEAVKEPDPVKQPDQQPAVQPEPAKQPEAVTPVATPAEPARWKTVDGHLSLVLPADWTVTGKGPYDFSAPGEVQARLYPAEAYADDAALTRALRAFVATQRDISIDEKKHKLVESPFTVDGATGVQVHYLNYVRHTTHGYAFGKGGRLWVLEIDMPTEDATVPAGITALTQSLRAE